MSDLMDIQCLGHFYGVHGKVNDPKKNEVTECLGSRWAEETLRGLRKRGGTDLRGKRSQLTSPSLVISINLFLLVSVEEP